MAANYAGYRALVATQLRPFFFALYSALSAAFNTLLALSRYWFDPETPILIVTDIILPSLFLARRPHNMLLVL